MFLLLVLKYNILYYTYYDHCMIAQLYTVIVCGVWCSLKGLIKAIPNGSLVSGPLPASNYEFLFLATAHAPTLKLRTWIAALLRIMEERW